MYGVTMVTAVTLTAVGTQSSGEHVSTWAHAVIADRVIAANVQHDAQRDN
jgi:hypothetical protein